MLLVDCFISRASDATMSLVELCRYGDLEGVKAALQSNADVNRKDKYGATGLIWAVFNNHNSVVDLLLNTPTIDVNWKNDEGWCALHFAVICSNFNNEGLKLLLNVPNIDVNIVTNNGWSALNHAVRTENSEVLKLLLKVPSIEVNFLNMDGDSALHVAVISKNNEVLKLLLDIPTIDVNIVNIRGESAVHKAVIEDNIEGFELLLNVPNINLETAMVALCCKGYMEGVKAALQRGVDVNATDKIGWTGLMGAVGDNHNSVVTLLLNIPNVDVNWKSNLGTCALHQAVFRYTFSKDNEVLKLLLRFPTIDVNIVDNDGESAVHVAVKWKNNEGLKLLLDVPNIDVNIVDNRGESAVHWAVKRENVEALKLLLGVPSVDVNIVNLDGDSALHQAVDEDNLEVLKLLLSHPSLTALSLNLKDKLNGDTPVMKAVMLKKEEHVAMLAADPRVDLDNIDKQGRSLEEIARWFCFVCWKCPIICHILINRAQVNLNDKL